MNNWLKLLAGFGSPEPSDLRGYVPSETTSTLQAFPTVKALIEDSTPQELASNLRLNQPFMFRDVMVELHYRDKEDFAYVTLHFPDRNSKDYPHNVWKLFSLLSKDFPLTQLNEWQNSGISWYYHPTAPTLGYSLDNVKKKNEENPIYHLQHQPLPEFEEILFRMIYLAGATKMLQSHGESSSRMFYEVFPFPDQAISFYVSAKSMFCLSLSVEDLVDETITIMEDDKIKTWTGDRLPYRFVSISEIFSLGDIDAAKTKFLQMRQEFRINEKDIASMFKKNLINTLAIKIEDEDEGFVNIFDSLAEYRVFFDSEEIAQKEATRIRNLEKAEEERVRKLDEELHRRDEEFAEKNRQEIELLEGTIAKKYKESRLKKILTSAQILLSYPDSKK